MNDHDDDYGNISLVMRKEEDDFVTSTQLLDIPSQQLFSTTSSRFAQLISDDQVHK